MITGTVPVKIVPTPRRITEGVKVIASDPYMEESEESRWVFLEEGKTWYYHTDYQAIELRKEA